MKKSAGILVAACLAASGAAYAEPQGRQPAPGPSAVAYACVSVPKTGEAKVVMTPPPPGFQCPPGHSLVLMTKATEDRIQATAAAQPDPPEPTVPAGTAVPRMASKKKVDKKLPCVEVDYALYCCIQRANGHLDCYIR